jgi:hypothetical protein
VTVAAPRPVFGFFDESSDDWVAVDVTELLDEFGVGEDVEVVITALPELFAIAFEPLRCLVFENVQSDGEWVEFWFRDQQVDVLGHEDVSKNVELMTGAELFEGRLEDEAGMVVIQIRKSTVAAEGDEVVCA